MWSHYAQKHNGIVLGFDFNKDKAIYKRLQPVKYDKELKKESTSDLPIFSAIDFMERTIEDTESSFMMEKENSSNCHDQHFNVGKF